MSSLQEEKDGGINELKEEGVVRKMGGNELRAIVKSASNAFLQNGVPVRLMLAGFSTTISCICNGITVVSRVGCIVRNATQERSSFSRVDSVGCFINKKNS